jgi:hypothetical protein
MICKKPFGCIVKLAIVSSGINPILMAIPDAEELRIL